MIVLRSEDVRLVILSVISEFRQIAFSARFLDGVYPI
jgi:hypothetical protein